MEVNDKLESFNPWNVKDIDQFLNYCCPECDIKQKTKSEFIAHAIYVHPNSRYYLPLFDLEDEKEEQQIIDPKEETNVSDLEFIEDIDEDNIESPDPLDTKLGDLEFKEEIIEDRYESSFEPPKKKLRNEHKNSDKSGVEYEIKVNEPKVLNGDVPKGPKRLERPSKYESFQEVKMYKWCGKLHPAKICNYCSTEIHPASYAKHVKKCYEKKCAKGEEVAPPKRPRHYERVVDPQDGIQKYKCDECSLFFKSTWSLLRHKEKNHSNDQKMQKCFLCAEAFPSKLIGRHLIRKHLNGNGVFECDFCSKLFTKPKAEQIMYHLTKEHQIGEVQHNCDQCDKTYALKDQLEKHKKIHDTNSRVICDKCGKEFQTKHYLQRHLKRVHNEYEIAKEDTIKKCDKCDLEFENPEEFNNHLKQCLDKLKDFECKICDSRWVSHLSLCHHIAVNHKLIRHICDICGHVSTEIGTLKKHKNVVHEKIYKKMCHLCSKQMSSNTQLNEHMINVHGIGERKFKCDQCDKSYSQKGHLNTHIKCIHEKLQYNCDKCDKSFSQKGKLKSHIESVHENILYNCEKCEKSFSTKHGLQYHSQSVHENVRYYCPKCEKSYSYKQQLNNHIQSVHENVRHKCDKCDQSFARKDNLNLHIKHHHESQHTPKTLYQCEQCPKTFPIKYYLQNHVRVIHDKVRPNKCDICLEGFYYKRDLASHKKQVHNIQE